MRVCFGRIPSRKMLIIIGLFTGTLIVLPASLLNHNLPVGMFGSVLLGMPIALSLQRTYGYDVRLVKRKNMKARIGSFLLMGFGALLFIVAISGMIMGQF